LELLRAENKDIDEIVSIHCAAFPNSRTTRMGRQYLRKQYLWFCEYSNPLAILACEEERLQGFAFGSTLVPAEYIFRKCWREILLSFIRNPALFFESGMIMSFVNRCRVIFRESLRKHVCKNKGEKNTTAYFSSMAVRPDLQGRRIGELLVKAFEDKALEEGCARVMVHTESDNFRVNNLFQKRGYVLEERIKNTNRFVKYLS